RASGLLVAVVAYEEIGELRVRVAHDRPDGLAEDARDQRTADDVPGPADLEDPGPVVADAAFRVEPHGFGQLRREGGQRLRVGPHRGAGARYALRLEGGRHLGAGGPPDELPGVVAQSGEG